jgi:hypothetical protein
VRDDDRPASLYHEPHRMSRSSCDSIPRVMPSFDAAPSTPPCSCMALLLPSEIPYRLASGLRCGAASA